MSWNDVIEAVNHLLTSVGLFSAAWWWWYTTQAKPRLQLEIEFSSWPVTSETMLGQVRLTFENKGFVEHKFHQLFVSAHGSSFSQLTKDGLYRFDKKLLPKRQITPNEFGLNFVRPGVRQPITTVFYFSRKEKTVLVSCRFGYTPEQERLHIYRRFFYVRESEPSEMPEADRSL